MCSLTFTEQLVINMGFLLWIPSCCFYRSYLSALDNRDILIWLIRACLTARCSSHSPMTQILPIKPIQDDNYVILLSLFSFQENSTLNPLLGNSGKVLCFIRRVFDWVTRDGGGVSSKRRGAGLRRWCQVTRRGLYFHRKGELKGEEFNPTLFRIIENFSQFFTLSLKNSLRILLRFLKLLLRCFCDISGNSCNSLVLLLFEFPRIPLKIL